MKNRYVVAILCMGLTGSCFAADAEPAAPAEAPVTAPAVVPVEVPTEAPVVAPVVLPQVVASSSPIIVTPSTEAEVFSRAILTAPPIKKAEPVFAAKWVLGRGEGISDAFTRWAKASKKWQVVWDASDIVSESNAELTGTFEEVATQAIDSLNKSGAGLEAIFYENNKVLRVMDKHK